MNLVLKVTIKQVESFNFVGGGQFSRIVGFFSYSWGCFCVDTSVISSVGKINLL